MAINVLCQLVWRLERIWWQTFTIHSKISHHLGKKTKWGIYRRVWGKKHSSTTMNSFPLPCLSRRRWNKRVGESWPLLNMSCSYTCMLLSECIKCSTLLMTGVPVFLSITSLSFSFCKTQKKYSSLPAEHNTTPAFINSAWSQKDLCQVWEVSNTHELQIAL